MAFSLKGKNITSMTADQLRDVIYALSCERGMFSFGIVRRNDGTREVVNFDEDDCLFIDEEHEMDVKVVAPAKQEQTTWLIGTILRAIKPCLKS